MFLPDTIQYNRLNFRTVVTFQYPQAGRASYLTISSRRPFEGSIGITPEDVKWKYSKKVAWRDICSIASVMDLPCSKRAFSTLATAPMATTWYGGKYTNSYEKNNAHHSTWANHMEC